MKESYCNHARKRKVKRLERVLSFYEAPRTTEGYNYDCKLTGKVCIVDLIERLTSKTEYQGDYFLFRCPGLNQGERK